MAKPRGIYLFLVYSNLFLNKTPDEIGANGGKRRGKV
jgi:hypothetical protein